MASPTKPLELDEHSEFHYYSISDVCFQKAVQQIVAFLQGQVNSYFFRINLGRAVDLF